MLTDMMTCKQQARAENMRDTSLVPELHECHNMLLLCLFNRYNYSSDFSTVLTLVSCVCMLVIVSHPNNYPNIPESLKMQI